MLTQDEATRLAARLCGNDAERVSTAIEKIFAGGARGTSLATVFRALG